MIVDSSAIMAILLDEPEKDAIAEVLLAAAQPSMSAGSWIELAAVITRRTDGDFAAELDAVVARTRMEIVAVSITQGRIGHAAYRKYGRGSGHEADLNFGDCFAYALAKERGEPLLYKGDDFGHTDIVAVPY